MSRATAVAVTGAALGTGLVARWSRARWLARRRSGSAPAVRTDDGVRLHVEVSGPDDAPATVVFAHGFAARSSVFDAQWAALRGRARLIRYDQRGHADSGWAGARSATVARLSRDLEQVAHELAGAGPVVLVGHSMGGMAVLALAGRRPELFGTRVAGVALLSTRAAPLPWTGSVDEPPGRVRMALTRAGAWLLWGLAPLVDGLQPFRSRPGRWLLRRRLFAGDASETDVRRMADAWSDTPAEVLAAYLTSLATYDRRAAETALRAVPVLVLAGTEDATIPPDSARRLAADIGASAELVLVDGAGHMVNLTHAEVVNAALDRLLSRAQAGAAERSTA